MSKNFIMFGEETRITSDENQFIVEVKSKGKVGTWKAVAYFPRLSQVYSHLLERGLQEHMSEDFKKLREHVSHVESFIKECEQKEDLRLKRISTESLS